MKTEQQIKVTLGRLYALRPISKENFREDQTERIDSFMEALSWVLNLPLGYSLEALDRNIPLSVTDSLKSAEFFKEAFTEESIREALTQS